ncbi:MAG: hypothetical protein QOH57_4733, partial [Mycobacterium sp.]|nr:hypothetical protein [Mycobacterium sp.]
MSGVPIRGTTATTTTGSGQGSPGLATQAIGLSGVLFQSVTFMAPSFAVALGIAAAAGFAGGALTLSVSLCLLGSLLVANSVGQLARKLSSAGGIYTYAAEGLHKSVGFLVAWGYSLVAALVGPITSLVFGYLCATVLQTEFNWPFRATWVALAILLAVSIAIINIVGVRFSAGVGVVLGLFEIAVFVALSIALIVKAGKAHNTLSVFSVHSATVQGFTGLTGVVAGAVYVMVAFIGFEAAAPLAEETRNPKKLIPRAVILSCLIIGLFYVLTTYALSVFVHPENVQGYGALGGGSPWVGFGKSVWGIGWVIVFFAILNSAFANGNSATIAVSRTWYAMARIRLLPRVFQRTHPKHQTPVFGILFQLVVTLAVGLPLGLKYGPVNGFLICATVLTAIMLAIYIVFNISCMSYYWRKAHDEFNWFFHFIVPAVGTLLFIPVLMTAVGIGKKFLPFV